METPKTVADKIEADLEALLSNYMYGSDVEDALVLVHKLRRLSYNEGYNSAAKQFGTEKEFFVGDVTGDEPRPLSRLANPADNK